MLSEEPGGPREHRACRLMPRNQERDEVVAQLLRRGLCIRHHTLPYVTTRALSYECTRPYGTSVRGLELLVYEALSY